MSDLKSKQWIVAKGGLFLFITLFTAFLIWQELPTVRTVLLLCILIWASARFYYFLFYVLERYVDPSLRYAGILPLLRKLMSRKTGGK
jgi:hypothetical protein